MAAPYQRHQKRRQLQQQASSSSNLSVLRGLPFWIWDKDQHRQQALASNGNCCSQHVCGLPVKDKCLIMRNYFMIYNEIEPKKYCVILRLVVK